MTIDILIPFWSRRDLLARAIDSVRAQSDSDWTLTVVDDCSAEHVRDLVDRLGDGRVRYLRNDRNLGITKNFQRCLDLATAEFTCIMGADDELLSNYVELVRKTALRFPSADVIEVDVQVIDAVGRPHAPLTDRVKRLLKPRVPGEGGRLSGQALAVSLLRGNWLYWPSLALRTDTARRVRFREDYEVIQDLAFMVDLITRGATLAYIPEIAFRYRRHTSSAAESARSDGTRFEGELRFFRVVAKEMRVLGWSDAEATARRHLIARLHAIAALARCFYRGGGLRAALLLAFGR